MKEQAKYIGVAAAVFAGDMWLKNRVERTREIGQDTEAAGGRLLLRRYHNRGAFLNLGEGKQHLVAAVSAALCTVLTLVFILTLGRAGSGLLKTGLSLLLGGAYSNTYDRLKRNYVVDYFSFGTKGKLRNIVFNISDFCILIGAGIVVLCCGKEPGEQR